MPQVKVEIDERLHQRLKELQEQKKAKEGKHYSFASIIVKELGSKLLLEKIPSDSSQKIGVRRV